MRHIINYLIILAVLAISTAQASEPISFDEAVRLALGSNPRILASNAQVEAAEAMITSAKGGFLPRFNMEIDAAHSNNPLNVFSYRLSQGNVTFSDFGISSVGSTPTVDPSLNAINSPGYYSNYNTGLVMSVPIFTGGYNKAMLDKSRHLLAEAQHGNNVAKNALIYDVLQAYEGVLVSQRFVKIAEKSLKSAKEYVDMTESLLKQSLVIESDLLIAQTNLRNAETSLKAHQAEYQTQLDTFRLLIGKPESDLVPGHVANMNLPDESIKGLEDKAVLNNPQLLSLKSRIEAARADVSAANAAYWPQIDLALKQEWNDENIGLSTPAGSVFVGFDWELFNFGIRSGASKRASAEHHFAQAEMNRHALDVRVAMAQAVRRAQTAEIQLKTSQDNRQSTAKALDMLKERYGRGAALLAQVLDSQSRYDTIKAQEVVAAYDIRMSKARVLQLLNEFEIDHE